MRFICTITVLLAVIGTSFAGAGVPNTKLQTLEGNEASAVAGAVEQAVAKSGSTVLGAIRESRVTLSSAQGGISVDIASASGATLATSYSSMNHSELSPRSITVLGDFAVAIYLAQNFAKEHGLRVTADNAYVTHVLYPAGVDSANYRGLVTVGFESARLLRTPAPAGMLDIHCEQDPSISVFLDSGKVVENPPAC